MDIIFFFVWFSVVRDCYTCTFTFRRLYVCLEMFLHFLHQSISSSFCLNVKGLCTTWTKCSCLHTSFACCICYGLALFLILHVDLISFWYLILCLSVPVHVVTSATHTCVRMLDILQLGINFLWCVPSGQMEMPVSGTCAECGENDRLTLKYAVLKTGQVLCNVD